MTNIFVAKLDFGVSDEELRALFARYGTVVKCQIAKDRETGKPRGFAFVEMQTAEETQAAIGGLDGHSFNGRAMVVKLAEDRSSGSASGPGAKRPTRPPQSSAPGSAPKPGASAPPRGEDIPIRRDDDDDDAPAGDFAAGDKSAKRVKVKKKKASDKPENREYKMSAYKKSGKRRNEFEDDDDWELELLKQKRRGWSDDDE